MNDIKALQFMEEIPFEMNDTKNLILIIHLNFVKEIPLKMNDTKKTNSNPLHFYISNPFKLRDEKK